MRLLRNDDRGVKNRGPRGGRLSLRVHALQSAEALVGLDAVDQKKGAGFPAHNYPCTKDNHGANQERRRSVVDVLRV
jgi:hypothetical protein